MIREKLCNFSSGLCFEKHNDFLLLKRIEWFVLDNHQEHITEEAVLQKHGEDARAIQKSSQ
jgi:hypothetical protein